MSRKACKLPKPTPKTTPPLEGVFSDTAEQQMPDATVPPHVPREGLSGRRADDPTSAERPLYNGGQYAGSWAALLDKHIISRSARLVSTKLDCLALLIVLGGLPICLLPARNLDLVSTTGLWALANALLVWAGFADVVFTVAFLLNMLGSRWGRRHH